MVDESENDEEDAKQPPTKKVEGVPGSCSGERDNNRKRGRESPVLQDPNKRQKVPDKQVNMERRSSVGNGNAEPVAREDSAGSKGSGSRVSPPNESESRSSRKLDEQSVEGLLLMDHDTEERQDVHKMLKIATGSGSNISEFVLFSSSTRLTCLPLDLQGSKYSTTGTRCITLCHEHRGDDRKRPSAFRRQF